MDEKQKNNKSPTNSNYKINRLSKKKSQNFWNDGLSIDETKVSCLIVCLLLGIIYVGFAYMLKGDISTNLVDIIIALIYAVASINVAGNLDTLINNRNQVKMKQMEYDHEVNMQQLNKSSDDYIDI